ncbi:MAG: PaaI family thioesterase [Pseudomonadota bacterium]
MTRDAIDLFLKEEFPQVFKDDALQLEEAGRGRAALRLSPGDKHLRPGGVISGPTLMMLADAAAYAALLSLTEEAKMAVTSNLNISFLRAAPPAEAIVQTAEVIKAGKRISVIVCEALGGDGTVFAHATMSYVMPAPAA